MYKYGYKVEKVTKRRRRRYAWILIFRYFYQLNEQILKDKNKIRGY